MKNRYDAKLDRLITHNGPHSSHSNGFHDFMMDEIELGARVALSIDDPEQAWWVLVGTPMLQRMEAYQE